MSSPQRIAKSRPSSARKVRRSLHLRRSFLENLEDRSMMATVPAPLAEWTSTPYVNDQMIVKFAEGTSEAARNQAVAAVGGEFKTYWEDMRMGVVTLPHQENGDSVLTLGPTLHAATVVEYAQPDYVRFQTAAIPNDPLYNQQWHLNNTAQVGSANGNDKDLTVPDPGIPGLPGADIDAQAAWDLSVGSAETVVAVIDTGVDYLHPDLKNNMWRNPGEIAGNNIDDDRNGYVDDYFGYDFIDQDPIPMDVDGHGTHVAGIIAAIGNNNVGVTGVSWNTKIMALRAVGTAESGIIGAIRYTGLMRLKYGINVVASNNSYGIYAGPPGGFNQAWYDAIRYASDAGVSFITSAGNRALNLDEQINGFKGPAEYNIAGVTVVAATDRLDQLADFSNYGQESVDIAAPGYDVLSTWPRAVANDPTTDLLLPNGYAYLSGTSMASPVVAGAVAVLRSIDPSLTPAQTKQILMRTGDRLPSLDLMIADPDLTDGNDYGARVNLKNAIQAIPHVVLKGKVFNDLNGNGIQDSGEGPLAGITVFTDNNNNALREVGESGVVSGTDGSYTIDAYRGAGQYLLRTVIPAGFQQTTPGGGGAQIANATSATQTISNLTFGLRRMPGSLSGTKWDDRNGSGVIDGGDVAMAGVTIFVDLNSDGRLGGGEPTAITDVNGNYTIANLPPGAYTVREVARPGWQAILPAGGVLTNVTVTAGAVTPNVSFLNRVGVDYGDAPLAFHSLNSNDGARHAILEGFGLGATIDGEADGIGSVLANGDDATGIDDEDGVTFPAEIFPGRPFTVTANIRNTSFGTGYFSLWIDYNADQVWSPSEKVLNAAVSSGNYSYTVIPPTSLVVDNVFRPIFSRARLSFDRNLGPDGFFLGGEVEDYRLTVGSTVPISYPDGPYTVLQDTLFAVNPLNVLANDVGSSFGSPQLVAGSLRTPPQHGAVRINNNGTPATATDDFYEYQPTTGYVGKDVFSYSSWDGNSFSIPTDVSIDVIPKVITPIEDILTTYFDTTTGQYKNTRIDVRANDIGPAYTASFTTITPPANPMGTLTVDTKGTVSTADDVLLYTPNASTPRPQGLETWTYVMTDSLGRTSTSTLAVQLNQLNSGADLAENSTRSNLQAELQVVPTDASGNPLTLVAPGQTFWLTVYTRDPRLDPNNDPGVKAATADLLYDSKVVSPTTGVIVFDDFSTPGVSAYNEHNPLQRGDTTVPGIVNEAGGINVPSTNADTANLYGPGAMDPYNPADPTTRYVLYRIEMRAANVNTLTNFFVAPADIRPPNDTSVISPTTAVPANVPVNVPVSNVNYVQFTGFQIGTGIAPGPVANGEGYTNLVVPGDVNGDRKIDTMDILAEVYEWNRFGTEVDVWKLQPGFYGRTNAMTSYVDVDGDGKLSVNDILHVIYQARRRGAFAVGGSQAQGEGEGESSTSTYSQQPVDPNAADAIFGSL